VAPVCLIRSLVLQVVRDETAGQIVTCTSPPIIDDRQKILTARPCDSADLPQTMAAYTLIHDACPSIHDDILRYAAGYIDDTDEEDNSPTEYVSSLLLSAGASQTVLPSLISGLNGLINERIARNPLKRSLEPVRLETTVHMSAEQGVGSSLHLVGAKVDLDSVTGRKVETRVDVKKLEKVLS
jgi:hypothetical protein